MSYKTVFVFLVLLATSFVHSFPNLSGSGGSGQNVHLAKLTSAAQSLNASYVQALFQKDDDSNASGGVDGYVDTFFELFFDEDDSSENKEPNTNLVIDENFDSSTFIDLLSEDIDKAYKRKCAKISGNDKTYSKVDAAEIELGVCLKNFVKSEEIRSTYLKLETNDDYNLLIKTLCRKRDVPIKCMDNFMAVDAQCSFPSEIESDNSIRRIVVSLLDLFCANDGNDLISLIFGLEGRQCLMENVDAMKICQYKEVYAIVKGFLVKLIENETFEFKMDEEDCKAFDDIRSCYVSAVEKCVTHTPKNYFASIYQIIRNETQCAKIAPITNLLD